MHMTTRKPGSEPPHEFELTPESSAEVDRMLDACDIVEELARLPFRTVSIETPSSLLSNNTIVIVKAQGQSPLVCRWFRKGGVAHIHGLDGQFRFRLLLKEIEWTRRVVESGYSEKDLKKGKATSRKKQKTKS